jgi:hypothetical protein
MSWPPLVGAAAILIEPTWLRPNHPMPPQRGEQMDGTRVFGLPASIDWPLGVDRNTFPIRHHKGTIRKPLLASHPIL